MLQSVLVLHTRPGRLDDLVEEYRRVGVIEAAVPFGLLRGEAVESAALPDVLLVTSLWAREEDYDGWLAADERVRVTAGLPAILDPERPPEVHKLPVAVDTDPADGLPLDAFTDGPTARLILVRP